MDTQKQQVIGAGVIGASKMATRHLDAYKTNPAVNLVGVCDIDESRVKEQQKEYDIPFGCTDYRELVKHPEVEVISIVTPDYVHAEQAIHAMEAGVDVLCEKPLALEMSDVKDIIAAVERTGRKFMIGQVCRFTPSFMLAKKIVDRGDIGKLFMVESEYAHNYGHARGANSWRVDARRKPLIGGGCHAVDLLRWIAGDIDEAFAYSNHFNLPDWPLDDSIMSVFKFKNGIIGKVMCSIGLARPYTMRSVFYGTEGTIICDNTGNEIQVAAQMNNPVNPKSTPQFASFPVNVDNHNIRSEVQQLIDSILNDTPVETDVYEGAKTVATCVAACQAAETGKAVKVDNLLK